MRAIKFRAWDKVNKCIEEIDGYNLFIADGKVYECVEVSRSYMTYMHREDVTERYELMQYTGLKDKNGKEIYEGDIIQNDWRILKVFWDEGGFMVIDQKENVWCAQDYCLSDSEIIGNLYENPELLEAKP